MELELGNLQKPVRILRNSLKSLTRDPPIEAVHNLRTHARRIEAIAAALMPGEKRMTRRLLKTIRPVRKAAGEVRDMDVLAGKARALTGDRRNHSVTCLLEYLSSARAESARELLRTVAEQRNDARRGLKQFSRQIEKQFHENKPGAMTGTTAGGSGGEAAMKLIDELSRWPAFNEENLHEFRIKVKELRYVLQLAKDADLKFVNALGKVKDRIGDWHDWQQMAKIAEKALNPKDDLATLEKIDAMGKKKLAQALAAASAMKTRYLSRYEQTGGAGNSGATPHPASTALADGSPDIPAGPISRKSVPHPARKAAAKLRPSRAAAPARETPAASLSGGSSPPWPK
jgi:CHAD domain-containing protein